MSFSRRTATTHLGRAPFFTRRSGKFYWAWKIYIFYRRKSTTNLAKGGSPNKNSSLTKMDHSTPTPTPHHTVPSSTIQVHFIPSGTGLAQVFLVKRVLHDANMFAQQGMGHGPRTLALSAVCTERANWASDHCHRH